jgi:hypothetical protein
MSDHEYAEHRGDDPSKSWTSPRPSERPRSEHHPAHEGRVIRGDRADRQAEYPRLPGIGDELEDAAGGSSSGEGE